MVKKGEERGRKKEVGVERRTREEIDSIKDMKLGKDFGGNGGGGGRVGRGGERDDKVGFELGKEGS